MIKVVSTAGQPHEVAKGVNFNRKPISRVTDVTNCSKGVSSLLE